MPTYNGKEITLLHLATHSSGLPLVPDNLDPKRADNPYADYTVEKLYAFLSGYQLTNAPGTKYEYSELGMELLGQVIALKAGTNYESLVVDRICRPLKMDSTRVTLTPELKSRLATAHDQLGYAVPGLDFQTLVGGSGLHSTANDLLKYLSANLGLTPSSLTPLMEKAHVVHFQSPHKGVRMALAWGVVYYPQGREFVLHGGGTPGCTTFVIFDKARRRGVVVLSSSNDLMNIGWIGQYLLESEWESDRRPKETTISTKIMVRMRGNTSFHPILRWECSRYGGFSSTCPKRPLASRRACALPCHY
jgi:D-alanyl-D-alanine-carboxypeptidase/D-alanyl-D-alanine-endopeptidase